MNPMPPPATVPLRWKQQQQQQQQQPKSMLPTPAQLPSKQAPSLMDPQDLPFVRPPCPPGLTGKYYDIWKAAVDADAVEHERERKERAEKRAADEAERVKDLPFVRLPCPPGLTGKYYDIWKAAVDTDAVEHERERKERAEKRVADEAERAKNLPFVRLPCPPGLTGKYYDVWKAAVDADAVEHERERKERAEKRAAEEDTSSAGAASSAAAAAAPP
uniref:Uncharacterized protein n=1 Tax=Chromera velia CCMP2878 TaxID=1169474 RepID=A0A0G4I5G1_9ALVE|eukprot:Cvel_11161.t1-p1 / transcript=Cvel_11161.t1 / gene=Cvel_11161 / organism=Chromera_velia_CCMP2878 / gene_product=hypothetical protein / transcript_product=hypothetical protein / location=Cvel_scaffold692:62493-63140(-) / protein_length=216 / sequence_SO=supercontig / SO=protein_coding / is_pseudo=false